MEWNEIPEIGIEKENNDNDETDKMIINIKYGWPNEICLFQSIIKIPDEKWRWKWGMKMKMLVNQ